MRPITLVAGDSACGAYPWGRIVVLSNADYPLDALFGPHTHTANGPLRFAYICLVAE